MSGSPTFIGKHGLWSDEQIRLAAEVARQVEAAGLRFVRLAWSDTHGYSGAKTLTVPAFVSALTNGYNIGVATTTLDSAGARVFSTFTRGGGMGLDEMTGSPNLTIVADPATSARCHGRRASAGFLAMNISTTAGRFISHRASCYAGRSAG